MISLRRVSFRIASATDRRFFLLSRLNGTENLEKYDVPLAANDNFISVRKEGTKSLRIAILGAPNSGKSTLINQLVNHQICASSAKKHTTRSACRAIFHSDDTELVFVDTPGVVSPQDINKHNLEENFQVDPKKSLHKADVVGVLHDVSNIVSREQIHPQVIDLLKTLDSQVPSLLLLNKVDKLKNKRRLLDLVKKLSGENGWPHFTDVFMLSALIGDGIKDLKEYFMDTAKPREWDFDQDTLTDQEPEDMIVRIVRANMLNTLPAEIPYQLDVKMEYFNICNDESINTYVLIECPSERIYKVVLTKLKPQLRGMAQRIEQALTKNFQRSVRLKLIVQPKHGILNKNKEKV